MCPRVDCVVLTDASQQTVEQPHFKFQQHVCEPAVKLQALPCAGNLVEAARRDTEQCTVPR